MTARWLVAIAGLTVMMPGWAQWYDARSNTAGESKEPILMTVGRGTVYSDPDSVRVVLGIETQQADLNAARRENEVLTQQVFAALGKLPIAELKVKSLGAAVQILRPYSNEKLMPVSGYRMRSQITVLATGKREQLGDFARRIVDTALSAGANTLNDVIFFITDSRAAERDAMKAAVQDARANLDTLAEGLGVKIKSYGILESVPSRQYSYRWSSWWWGGDNSGMRQFVSPADAAGSPMVAGQLEVTVTARLTATY
jgi:uncharacterized protein